MSSVSYAVITPSAARGILEAILMKPIEKPESCKRDNKVGFRWLVTRISAVRSWVRGSGASVRGALGKLWFWRFVSRKQSRDERLFEQKKSFSNVAADLTKYHPSRKMNGDSG